MIEIQGLTKEFKTVTAVKNLTLTVNEGAQPRVRTDICPAAYVLLAILGIGAAVCAIYIRTHR